MYFDDYFFLVIEGGSRIILRIMARGACVHDLFEAGGMSICCFVVDAI